MTRRSGFTLLEAIVSLAIVSIVCIGVLAAEGNALRAEATSTTRLPLMSLAHERLAVLEAYTGPLELLPDSAVTGTFAPPFEAVRHATRVRAVANHRGLWDATVIVSQARDSVTLHSRLYRPVVSSR